MQSIGHFLPDRGHFSSVITLRRLENECNEARRTHAIYVFACLRFLLSTSLPNRILNEGCRCCHDKCSNLLCDMHNHHELTAKAEHDFDQMERTVQSIDSLFIDVEFWASFGATSPPI
eukprot:gb/GECG01002891.1/.p1 GENE.gb/GECG01002891.1/~~gb/GECG01002891.1/.p1  ORF type:complete len:118 (+),score=4.85 gb/GECG01002891.1/:1-354(+)